MELKKAKTASELASAKASKSKADLDDLTFIERESGIDHEKAKELERQKVTGDILKERAKYLNNSAGVPNE